uniref:Activator of basal transcription 1 n=1 Tax=Panagrolaimus sp. ES5 TaxID=591445 RepID=A0AC34FLA6_9BILA
MGKVAAEKKVAKKGKKKSKFINEKRDVRDIKVIRDKLLTIEDIEKELAEEDNVSSQKELNAEERQRRSGVVYFPTIPPGFTVSRMREDLSKLAEIKRIYLKQNRKARKGPSGTRYVEGWVEFASKRKAKMVAEMLCGNMVLGKRTSLAYDSIWTCKYLHGFKWVHLMEQLVYEQRVEDQRLRAELRNVKKQAEFFADQVEKGSRIKRLEEKVLKKGGLWEKYCRQVEQRKSIRGNKKASQNAPTGDEKDDLMKMIFDAKSDEESDE